MESRKITVVSTANHIKKTIMSSAETLGQLKADFDANNIQYNDMTFYEGLSKTELISDDSILPKNINYKGVVTNDLVFMLTYSNKKIKSGSIDERMAVYDKIKELALQDKVKEIYGKPYTMVKTAELVKVIDENTKSQETIADNVVCDDTLTNLVTAFKSLVNTLNNNGYIDITTFMDIMDKIDGVNHTCKCSNTIESPYSEEELDDMFVDFK